MVVSFSCANIKYENEQLLNESILLNQIGFYPDGKKTAIYKGKIESGEFELRSAHNDGSVFTGKVGENRNSAFSDVTTHVLDFTDFTDTGEFYIYIPAVGRSHTFEVEPAVHDNLLKASLKSYYFQRTFTPLSEEFAGKWAREAGHPDTIVYIHSSAATVNRPEGTIISAPYGWYDAGDYNKYIVNSGITVGTLLSLYEDFPEFFNTYNVGIPESNNELPDLIDEVLWNVKWMLAMQDPDDGGVYHKLTTADFEGMVMPNEGKAKRYVVQKSITATLDYAAVMAQAARVFSSFETQLPGLSDSCLHAAIKAWNWAQKNPDVLYDQGEMNKKFKPEINTGAYGDKNMEDEESWAAAELWITTGDERYLNSKIISPDGFSIPSWGNVRSLAYYSILRHQDKINATEMVLTIKDQLIGIADEMAAHAEVNAYGVVMGKTTSDFVWGSNAVAGNQSIALIHAYALTGDDKYLDAAITNLDYLLGRNATGYSFVTGYGDKTPMHPHHRPSVADSIVEPVPGLLAGGPNPGQQDDCDYPSDVADESYVDHDCSYASNEVAINWNAPLVYTTGAVEAIKRRSLQLTKNKI